MTILDEKEPTPSLALIAAFVAIVTAVSFGGMWAYNHTINAAPTPQTQEAPSTVEGNI